jgi:polyhydroxybutyrate depolymerase
MINIFSLTGLFIIGFTAAKAQSVNLHSDSLLIDGNYRSFYYAAPEKNRKNPALIFILHGSGGTGLDMVPASKNLAAVAGKENLILVYPNGYQRFWNECRKASTAKANLENVDESGFFNGMINYFKKNYLVGLKKIFVIGFSGGGQMAFKLAMTKPETYKAVTSVVANLPTDENMDCTPLNKPISILLVNGTADPVCPYNGGEMKAQNITLGTVKSTMQTLAYWGAVNGIGKNLHTETLPDPNPLDSISIVKYSFTGKYNEVRLYCIINGKHEFPKDLDVFTESLRFFKKQLRKKIKK